MGRVRFTPAARADLAAIRRYIAKDNPVRAKSYILEIRDHCRRLAHNPTIHPVDTELDEVARKAIHDDYLIFYEATAEGMLVLRVLHGARDLTNLILRT